MSDFPYALRLDGDQIEVSFNLRAWRLLLSRPEADRHTREHLRVLVERANSSSTAMATCHYDHYREQFVVTAQSAHERSLGWPPVVGEGETLATALRALADALERDGRDKDQATMRLVFG